MICEFCIDMLTQGPAKLYDELVSPNDHIAEWQKKWFASTTSCLLEELMQVIRIQPFLDHSLNRLITTA